VLALTEVHFFHVEQEEAGRMEFDDREIPICGTLPASLTVPAKKFRSSLVS
jgi:hypothetical protein